MLKEQLTMLGRIEQLPPPPVISIEDLYNKSDRTLLYGYTCDRQTHHVYIKDNTICVALYDGLDFTKMGSVPITCNQDYVPNKRVYPTRSDFEFCALLLRHGVEILFTEFEQKELLANIITNSNPPVLITREELDEIVATNSKKRLNFNEDKTMVRASQGHSIPVKISYKKLPYVPDVLYHGTASSNVSSIRLSGLEPRDRTMVHLSFDKKLALEVGRRHSRDVVLFEVDADKLVKCGYDIFVSDNGVPLMHCVPPNFLRLITADTENA